MSGKIIFMTAKSILALAIALTLIITALGRPAAAGEAVSAKQFPSGYFLRLPKAPVAAKEKTLKQLEATLQKLNREGLGLIAKGAVIGKPRTDQTVYDRLEILDESGLIITARRVPNLYYGYRGPGPLNPNLFIVIKKARVNFTESYIRYGFVVEGDFVAYADKFVTAIMENLEGAGARPGERPEERPRK